MLLSLQRAARGDAVGRTAAEEPALELRRVEALHSGCNQLQLRLETLAADALECGCNRGMAGAMDVFQAASTAVDRMAGILHLCREARVEAQRPPGCEAVEWRLAAAGTRAPEELAALRQLLEALQDCRACEARQPATVLRYLRARNGRAPEAEKMFRACMDWRQYYRIESRSARWRPEEAALMTWRSRLVNEFKIHSMIGKDRFGLPVYLFRWSAFDAVGAQRELGVNFLLHVMLCIHEHIAAEMRAVMLLEQVLVPGCLYVWDLGNYGRHSPPNWWSRMLALVRFLPSAATLLESNYPEVVRKIVVVRSGPATRALYQTATPFLPAATLAKLKLHGWRAREWLGELHEEMPLAKDGREPLPAFLTCDSEAAIASARPRGGVYPVGAAAAARLAAGAARQTRASRSWGRSTSAGSCASDSEDSDADAMGSWLHYAV